ncbi:hypothetical protein FPSE5266_20309 [Fusarium pseudograminearum]|nr:hypothetical protein FPSE5266_20309 [Fusarium pseudograminearum]
MLTNNAPIRVTYLEAKENFPDFNLVVFYGIRSTLIDKDAKVIGLGELIPPLDKLDPHSPKTGKTLVITSYTTLSARFIKKQETLFTYKPEKVRPSLQKKRDKAQKKKDTEDSGGEQSDDDDESDDGDMALARRRKVPVYSRQQVNIDDIVVVDDPKIADGNIVWYKRTQEGIKNICFQFVVCDEAQVAREADGLYNNLLRKFQWRILLWTSGTSLSNSLRDLISPPILMWKALGIQWNPAIGRIGYLPGLYHKDYDPLIENNEIRGQITKGILHRDFLANNKGAEALLPFWQNEKSRLWMLHPEIYKAAGMKHHWGSNLAAWVVRPIFEYMHIRRTMRTPLRLPDGYMTYPGIDLLPPTIVRLFKPANDDGAMTSQAIEGTSSEATLNFGVHRQGVLTTFDWRNTIILDPANQKIPGSKKDIELRVQSLLDPSEPKTRSELERMKKNEAAQHDVILGVDHVQRLISKDPNGGLTWLYNMTHKDEAALAPSDRAAMLRWVEWIFLKIKNSYHDNIERLAISKWAPQLSAEINLPDWVQDELREILIYEIIKTHMTQPINRYSWIVLRDMFGHDFDHHGKSVKFLGHVFSIIAKIVLQTDDVDKQFWLDNMHLLTLGCFEIINDKTVDFTQELLSDAGRLKAFFTPLLISAFRVVNGKLKNDDKTNHLIKDGTDIDDEDDGELKLEEDEDELGTRRIKPSKKSRFQSVAPKTMNDTLQLDSDDDGMDHAADIAYMQEQLADGVEAPAYEPLAYQEGEQVEHSGEEFQTPTNKCSTDVEADEVEEPDPKRARTD